MSALYSCRAVAGLSGPSVGEASTPPPLPMPHSAAPAPTPLPGTCSGGRCQAACRIHASGGAADTASMSSAISTC